MCGGGGFAAIRCRILTLKTSTAAAADAERAAIEAAEAERAAAAEEKARFEQQARLDSQAAAEEKARLESQAQAAAALARAEAEAAAEATAAAESAVAAAALDSAKAQGLEAQLAAALSDAERFKEESASLRRTVMTLNVELDKANQVGGG